MLCYVTSPFVIVQNLHPTSDQFSRLCMSTDGTKPANPFSDEPQFEESLQMNFHPGTYTRNHNVHL